MPKARSGKESLFYLTTPLEQLIFISLGIGRQTYGHISLPIDYSFQEAARILCALSHRQDGTYHAQPLMDLLWTTGWNRK